MQVTSTPRFLVAALCAGVLLAMGCDDGNPHHDPPPGLGSIIVDNRTTDTIHFYINGLYQRDVGEFDWEAADLPPGMVRVVLDQKGGDSNYRDDVDVMVGQNTIMEVRGGGPGGYDVRIHFD